MVFLGYDTYRSELLLSSSARMTEVQHIWVTISAMQCAFAAFMKVEEMRHAAHPDTPRSALAHLSEHNTIHIGISRTGARRDEPVLYDELLQLFAVYMC